MTRSRAVMLAAAVLGPVLAMAVTAGPASANTPGRYVALGDSYAAAPLVPVQQGTPAGCLRSSQNYPSLVAKQLAVTTIKDVSCSGATTVDMTSPQKTGLGTNPPQLDALTPDTSLVTLTIGGNDVGFTSIIEQCAARSSTNLLGAACKAYYTSGGSDQLAQRIADTGPKVAATLAAIGKRSPDAHVVVVGYPGILPDTGSGCYPVIPFSPGDVAYLRSVEKALNTMLAERAERAGATYVDTYTPSIGHDACQLPGTKWIEGIVPTAPAAPVHPNALGTAGQAAAVVAAIAGGSAA